MAAGATADKVLHCVFDGSISTHDIEIERRPYNCNCDCALHKLNGMHPNACSSQGGNISFPRKRAFTRCSLSFAVSKFFTHSSHSFILSDLPQVTWGMST